MMIGDLVYLIYYQLMVNTYGQAIGLEILARFRRYGELISYPEAAAYLAKEGLVAEADLCAARAAVALLKRGYGGKVHVNVAISTLENRSMGHTLVQTLGAAHNKQLVVVEINEAAPIRQMDNLMITLKALRDHGIGLALDDFGAAYSIPLYLSLAPYLTEIKLDKALVWVAASEPRTRPIAKKIFELLGERTLVAEGIETVAQQRLMADWGVHALQGFLYHRPESIEKLTR